MKNCNPYCRSLLAAMLIAPLLFFGCGTKELEFESPYEEVEAEFDEIADLPEVDDTEPEIIEPVYEEVSTPTLVSDLLDEIEVFAEDEKIISENSMSELTRLNEGLEELGLDLNDHVNIDAAYLEGMMEMENPMDEEMEALLIDFMEKNGLDAPLPEIPEVEDIPDMEALQANLIMGIPSGANHRVMSGNNGSCFQRVQEIYDRKVSQLDEQLEAAIDRINAIYLRRIEAAEKRLKHRNKQADAEIAKKMKFFHHKISKILKASVNAGKKGNKKLSKNLRSYSLIYAYHIRKQLGNLHKSYLAYNKKHFKKEIQKIEKWREYQIAKVMKYYEEAIERLKRLLEKAIARCHNQGGGN